MKIDKHDKYIVLGDEKDDVGRFATYLERIVPERYENDNLVIDLLKYEDLTLDDLLMFLKLSNYHRSTKHSFVLVNDRIDVDDVPLEMILVPSLVEAGDIVEMEEIERDLGF
ncbi:MAG: ribonuclease Z [Bacteroidia bacterium]|nr:ribonuclease Z [Bacteroidia bacterium]NNM22540.1 ribonuclease Z [Flavobacteriaceae bacterium]